MRSDQGTNLVGAKRELKDALLEMDNKKVQVEMLKLNCDWFETKLNVPSASHMGGASGNARLERLEAYSQPSWRRMEAN